MANFYDIETEKMFLSAVMNNNKLLLESSLNPDEFYLKKHKAIFKAYLDMSKNNIPIELVTLYDFFGDGISDVGGATYISEISGLSTFSSSIKHYEKIIKEKYIRRKVALLCREVYKDCESDTPVNELISSLQSGILDMEYNNKETIKHISELMPVVIEQIEKTVDNKNKISYSSGLIDMDRFTGGWGEGDLIIVAGRPGQGKSALTKNFIDGITGQDNAVGVFSLEMSPEQLIKRHISDHSMVSIENMMFSDRVKEQFPKLIRSAKSLAELNIYMVQGNVFNINKISLLSKHLKYKYNVKLIVIDYLQLIIGKSGSKEEEMADISRTLKLLARELNIPIICLSQLNRECEKRIDKRPLLSDLRSSGAIEQDADMVIFLYRDEYYNPNSTERGIAEIILAKHRNGRTGIVKVGWLAEFMKFTNLAKERSY